MAVRQYVGARYVPKFYQNSQNQLYPTWEGNKSYEALTIVTYNNDSYTSKIPVPAGIGNPANNPTYWVCTGNYNAQVEQYRQTVENYKQTVDSIEKTVTNTVNISSFGIVGDGVTDVTDAINNAIDSVAEGTALYFPSGTYLIKEIGDEPALSTDSTATIVSKFKGINLNKCIHLYGDGDTTIFKGIDPVGSIGGCIINVTGSGCSIDNIRIEGNYGVHQTVNTSGNKKDEFLWGICAHYPAENIYINRIRCNNCFADGITLWTGGKQCVKNIIVNNSIFTNCGRNGIQVGKCWHFYSSGCYFNNMDGSATTGCAYDIESHDYITKDVHITNCSWENTVQGCAFNSVDYATVTNCTGEGSYAGAQVLNNYHFDVTKYSSGVTFANCYFNRAIASLNSTFINCNIPTRINLQTSENTTGKCHIKGCTTNAISLVSSINGEVVIEGCDLNSIGYFENYVAKNIVIINNIIRGGIELINNEYADIHNNIFMGDSPYAIRIAGYHIRFNNNVAYGKLTSYGINLGKNSTDTVLTIANGNTIEVELDDANLTIKDSFRLHGATIYANNNSINHPSTTRYGIVSDASVRAILNGNTILTTGDSSTGISFLGIANSKGAANVIISTQ